MTDESERRPPAWVDKATLMRETCLGERTVDTWVKGGLLPPPRLIGGKLMWRWIEVDQYLVDGGARKQDCAVNEQEEIRAATERETNVRTHA